MSIDMLATLSDLKVMIAKDGIIDTTLLDLFKQQLISGGENITDESFAYVVYSMVFSSFDTTDAQAELKLRNIFDDINSNIVELDSNYFTKMLLIEKQLVPQLSFSSALNLIETIPVMLLNNGYMLLKEKVIRLRYMVSGHITNYDALKVLSDEVKFLNATYGDHQTIGV